MAQGPFNGDWDDIRSRLPQLPGFLKAGMPAVIVVLILIIWLASGVYTVGPGEQRRDGQADHVGLAADDALDVVDQL